MTAPVWMLGVFSAVIGLAITAALTCVVIKISHRRGWLDYPDSRKRHRRATPQLGGVTIFVTFWGMVFTILAFRLGHLTLFARDTTVIFIGAVAIFLLGLFDDFHPLRARSKLAVQVLVGIWLWFSGLSIDLLWIPTVGGVELGVASLPITLAWFILLVNAVNIIDGLDGLAAGVCLIGLASVIVIGIRTDIPDAIILSLILAGSLGGFLAYNRPPARIFLGDSGSLSLGYFFAVLALWLPIKRYTVVAVYVPVLALLVPLAEAAWSIFRRVASGKKPTVPDRGHLHFRLIDRGFSAGGVRLLLYCLSVAGFAFSLAVAYGNRRFWMVVFVFFVSALIVGLYILLRTPERK